MFLNKKKIWNRVFSEKKIEELPWVFNTYPQDIFDIFISNIKEGYSFLDYGGGTGKYVPLFQNKFDLTVADISEKALEICKNEYKEVKVVCTTSPSCFKNDSFGGILCWGVLHHIEPKYWRRLIKDFKRILKKEGFLLLGGFSINDFEFQGKKRISPFTKKESFAFDCEMEEILKEQNFDILLSGEYHFIEAITNNNRIFKYYLLQAKQ